MVYFDYFQLGLICTIVSFQVAKKSFIPALFGHATEDAFIQPHHSDLIFKAYSVSLTSNTLYHVLLYSFSKDVLFIDEMQVAYGHVRQRQ